MKKLFSVFLILVICAGNAQNITPSESYGQAVFKVLNFKFVFPSQTTCCGNPLLVSFNNELFLSKGVTISCLGLQGINKLPANFYCGDAGITYCGSLKLPPGKQWAIEYALNLGLDGIENIVDGVILNNDFYAEVYYGQNSPLTGTCPNDTSYRVAIGSSSSQLSIPSSNAKNQSINLKASNIVLDPQHPTEPVYLYLVLSFRLTGELYGPIFTNPITLRADSIDF